MIITEQDHIEKIRAIWSADYGYESLSLLPDGRFVCIHRLAFTYAILSDLNGWGYEDRWCFATRAKAEAALADWIAHDGEGEPQGWHRHPDTGRRRPDGDATKEYVER